MRLGDVNLHQLPDQGLRPFEIHHAVGRGTACNTALPAHRGFLHQNLLRGANQRLLELIIKLANAVLQDVQATILFFQRDVFTQVRRRRSGTPAVDEALGAVDTPLFHGIQRPP